MTNCSPDALPDFPGLGGSSTQPSGIAGKLGKLGEEKAKKGTKGNV